MKNILLIIFSLAILSGCVEKVLLDEEGRERTEIIESTKKQEIDLS